MPLPLTVSCFGKIQIGFTFLVLAHLGSPGKRAVKRVCVCAGSLGWPFSMLKYKYIFFEKNIAYGSNFNEQHWKPLRFEIGKILTA